MATIADTLNDVQTLQKAMSAKVHDRRKPTETAFVRALMNFTTITFLVCSRTPR